MKSLFFVVTTSYFVFITDSRLLGKTTPKKTSDLLTRVTRAAFEEDTSAIFSKEDELRTISGELFSTHNDKMIHTKAPRHTLKLARIVRDSSETHVKNVTNVTKVLKLTSTTVSIKKPIPKFVEKDNEDDFQARLMKSQNKFADSSEHEDEDFNVDDYDFDVNHDEFAGRGKPLEPRVKNKQLLEQQNLEDVTKKAKHIKAKAQPPTKVVSKRHHIAEKTKKVADKVKEDYYDDYSSAIVKHAEQKKQMHDSEDVSSESEGSKEYIHKLSRSRRAIVDSSIRMRLLADKLALKS